MPTLRQLLLYTFNTDVETPDGGITTSRVPDGAANYGVVNPDQNQIFLFNSHAPDEALGPRSGFIQRILDKDGEDHLNGYRHFGMVLTNEGEVRFLLGATLLSIQARFGNMLRFRFEVGPNRVTSSFSGTVDCRIDFAPLSERTIPGTGTIGTATIIELKKPGTLAYANFGQYTPTPTRTKERLGKKWRW